VRALLINQYFWPDMAATAQLLADLAEDLAAVGWRVTAVAGRGSYAPGREGSLPRREDWRNVTVRRVWCTDFGRRSALGRVCDYATFLGSAAIYVAFGRWARGGKDEIASAAVRPRNDRGCDEIASGPAAPRNDRGGDEIASGPMAPRNDTRPVVVCLSTPPLLAVLGLLARLRGARFVYKVEDLYPDVAVALGTLRAGSPVTALLRWLSRRLLRGADAVVALDEGMRQVIAGHGARHVEVIPNWADGEAIATDDVAGAAFRRAHGLEGRFAVLYSGNLGLAHRFDAVIGSARLLAEREPRVLFLFVGDGPKLPEVRRHCEGLPNVAFLPYQPRETLRALYAAADVHLVTLRDEVRGLLVPSKFAAALAAGKPVLLVGGDRSALGAEIVREGVGWCCPHEPGAVVGVIESALDDGAGRAVIGARARALFEARYGRQAATRRWAELLAEVAGA